MHISVLRCHKYHKVYINNLKDFKCSPTTGTKGNVQLFEYKYLELSFKETIRSKYKYSSQTEIYVTF